jgi:integrase
MARVKDLWFSEVVVRGPDGKAVKGPDGRAVKERRKTAKHPDNGGSKAAKRWLACWTDPDGKEDTQAFHKKTDAKAHGERMEADAERGEYIARKAGNELFGDLATKLLRLRKVGGSTRQKYERTYRNQVEAAFAHRKVRVIKPSDVLEWLNSPAMKLSESVRVTAFMIVCGVFDLAVADGLRRDNPARSPIITPPREELAERTPWNAAQVWLVHDEHPEPYRPIVACGAWAGMRQGEALALADTDIDYDAMKIHIRRQLELVGRTWVFKLPKEGRTRTVPMPRGLAAIFQAHVAAYSPRPYELPWMEEDGEFADAPHTCNLLFRWHGDDPRVHGKHIKFQLYNSGVWKPALVRAGIIIPPPDGPDAQPATRYFGSAHGNGTHILRHFYSTTLQDAGVSLAGVMEFMGHSMKGRRLPTTLGVYGHVTDETYEQARQAVDKALFRPRPVRSGGTVAELRAAQ